MKTLICITTSNRSAAVKALSWKYIELCQRREGYYFVISLDGQDEATINFCKKHRIPFIYSEEQEGVGISKNRVLKTFPDFEHYFFIEDDVELLNDDVFEVYKETARKLGLHHMSLFPEERIGEPVKEMQVNESFNIIASMYGSAQFNYFTKKGIDTVGGFHTDFAKYRRFGHTEHSYRFVNSDLAEYPFYVIKECLYGWLGWNDPVSVTRVKVDTVNRVFIEEHKLIEKKLKYFPIKILSKFYMHKGNDFGKIQTPRSSLYFRIIFASNIALINIYRKIKKIGNIK